VASGRPRTPHRAFASSKEKIGTSRIALYPIWLEEHTLNTKEVEATMDRIKIASAAGLVATLVIGSMLIMNNAVHGLPNVGIGKMLASLLGEPDHVFYGWLAFLVLGTFVCSNLFAFLEQKIPIRSYLVKGLLFALVSWLIAMVVLWPLVGADPFLLDRGYIHAAETLVLSLVYWLVFSLIYRWLWTAGRSTTSSQRVEA
jgi:hypothetical protein